MNTYTHTGTEDTPTIILDASANKIEFSGRSMPENVADFYSPVLNWIEEYGKQPNQETVVVFKLDYFNTASSKIIMDIMMKFEEIHSAGHAVKINWYYQADDEDMLEAGEGYADIVEIPFECYSY